MMKTNKHIVPHEGMWAVKSEGASRITRVFELKTDALKYAHDVTLRDNTFMFVHKKNGKVSSVRCPARRKSALLMTFQDKYGLK